MRNQLLPPRRSGEGGAGRGGKARRRGGKALGSGCARCSALEELVQAALAVDGNVVPCGRVLKKDEAKAVIQRVRAGG